MREIKFRAWTEADGGVMLEPGDAYGTRHPLDVCTYLIEGQDVELMQYTGLKDKNGNEIYEGDIINYGVFALNDVEKYGKEPWNNLPDGILKDDISTVKSTHKVDFFIPSLMAIKEAIENNPDVTGVEVIGNVYENPGLLEDL